MASPPRQKRASTHQCCLRSPANGQRDPGCQSSKLLIRTTWSEFQSVRHRHEQPGAWQNAAKLGDATTFLRSHPQRRAIITDMISQLNWCRECPQRRWGSESARGGKLRSRLSEVNPLDKSYRHAVPIPATGNRNVVASYPCATLAQANAPRQTVDVLIVSVPGARPLLNGASSPLSGSALGPPLDTCCDCERSCSKCAPC